MNDEKVSTYLYIGRGVLKTAKNLGLNVSKVSENALIGAIGRLRGLKPETNLDCHPKRDEWGRGRELNPGDRLHRPIGYQATSPRPLFE